MQLESPNQWGLPLATAATQGTHCLLPIGENAQHPYSKEILFSVCLRVHSQEHACVRACSHIPTHTAHTQPLRLIHSPQLRNVRHRKGK